MISNPNVRTIVFPIITGIVEIFSLRYDGLDKHCIWLYLYIILPKSPFPCGWERRSLSLQAFMPFQAFQELKIICDKWTCQIKFRTHLFEADRPNCVRSFRKAVMCQIRIVPETKLSNIIYSVSSYNYVYLGRCLIYSIAKNYSLNIELSEFISSDIVLQLLVLQLSKACLYSTAIFLVQVSCLFLKEILLLALTQKLQCVFSTRNRNVGQKT